MKQAAKLKDRLFELFAKGTVLDREEVEKKENKVWRCVSLCDSETNCYEGTCAGWLFNMWTKTLKQDSINQCVQNMR